jgi:hypothetical protein
MDMKFLPPLALAAVLSGCAWRPCPRLPPVEEDTSIVFPRFNERAAVVVGAQGEPYDMDGVTLRAIQVAANDFLPPGREPRTCLDRQEAHRYRVIRQGDVLFVQIYVDPTTCGRQYMVLDGSVRYAISAEGRILRRRFDGEPEGPLEPAPADAGVRGTRMEPGVPPAPGPLDGETPGFLSPERRDAGPQAPPPLPMPVPPAAPEGGSPPVP